MNNITVTVSIENINDIRSFIKKVSMIKEFAKIGFRSKIENSMLISSDYENGLSDFKLRKYERTIMKRFIEKLKRIMRKEYRLRVIYSYPLGIKM